MIFENGIFSVIMFIYWQAFLIFNNNVNFFRFTRRAPTWRRTSARTRGRSRTAATGRGATGGSPGPTSSPGITGSIPAWSRSSVIYVNEHLRGVIIFRYTWNVMYDWTDLKKRTRCFVKLDLEISLLFSRLEVSRVSKQNYKTIQFLETLCTCNFWNRQWLILGWNYT